jgi:hypothetical protein
MSPGPFLDALISYCFAEPDTLALPQTTFAVLSPFLISDAYSSFLTATSISLALWKLAQADLATRERALDVLVSKLPSAERQKVVVSSERALHNSFFGMSSIAHRRLSELASTSRPESTRGVLLELTNRLLQSGGSRQFRQILQLLPPWLSSYSIDAHPFDPIAINLFLLTAKYGDICHHEIISCWDAIVHHDSNTDNGLAIAKWLVDETTKRGSRDFIKHAQRVIGCLAEGPLCAPVLQLLATHVNPGAILAVAEGDSSESQASSSLPQPRRTALDSVFPILPRRLVLSSAQTALLLAVDPLIARLDQGESTLPKFLHALVMQADQPILFLRAQARDCLIRIISVAERLVATPDRWGKENLASLSDIPKSPISNGRISPSPPTAAQWASRVWPWNGFWDHEERHTSRELGRTPASMAPFLDDALRFLTPFVPTLREEWAAVALSWAISCPLRHIACRSFQTVRLLKPRLDQQMLAEMVMRLSTTISDDSPDSQLFAKEILYTLSDVVRASDMAQLEAFPQLFWTVFACLETSNEAEFHEAILIAQDTLEKLDGGGREVSLETFEAHRPQSFRDGRRVLTQISHRGLRSGTTEPASWSLVRFLATSSRTSSLIAPRSVILLQVYATCLPWCLQALEVGVISDELENLAASIARFADEEGKSGISRVMTSLARNRFRTKDDFLRQSVANVKEYFALEERLDFLVFLTGLLLNPIQWLRQRSLALLKSFVRVADFKKGDLSTLGLDLLAPLLPLFDTDLAPQALQVFEEPVPWVRGALDRYVPSRSGASSRRPPGAGGEDEIEGPLVFGKASESGWCVPDPETSAAVARKALREIVETFAVGHETAQTSSPVEFAAEEYPFSTEAGVLAETKSARSDGGDNSTLGDLVSQLHDLGDFFDNDPMSSSPAFRMSQMMGSASRVAAVLSRSLKPPSSSSSSRSRDRRGSGGAVGGPGGVVGSGSSSGMPDTPFTTAFSDSPNVMDEFEPESSSGGEAGGEWAEDEDSHEASHETASLRSASTGPSSLHNSHHHHRLENAPSPGNVSVGSALPYDIDGESDASDADDDGAGAFDFEQQQQQQQQQQQHLQPTSHSRFRPSFFRARKSKERMRPTSPRE